ncbi:MAG: transporter substrate-binding domain-containing protein [Actinomycetota bacterium]|nr:transporter substrate-binding domain-containing protein [Actinomycetota bacterium]
MTFQTLRTGSVRRAALAVAVAALVACVPAPEEPEDEGIPVFDIETAMGQIQASERIIIGVDATLPPLSFLDERGRVTGLAVELGELIAEGLGVQPVYRMGSTDALLEGIGVGLIDVAFPATPITEQMLRSIRFSDPYYVAHQRLLVPRDSEMREVEDLGGRTVCSSIHPETGVALDELDETIRVQPVDAAEECRQPLLRGTVDAATGPDLFLFGLDAPGFLVAGDQLSTEGYGVAVRGSAAFSGFVDGVFADAREHGRWQEIFERWLGRHSDQDFSLPPPLTVEEAAALFPADPADG